MKRSEIQRCGLCGRGVMHSGSILFTQVTVERFGVDAQAVRRQHGLEQFMGSPVLAGILGPDEDLAVSVSEKRTFLVCDPCSGKSHLLDRMMEQAIDAERAKAEAEGTERAA